MGVRRYELTDEEWRQIKGYIPQAKHGRPPKDHRQMSNAMIWLAKSGAMWEDLPERYGPWKTVYSRFCKWRDEGVLTAIFTALSMDADYENLRIDSTCQIGSSRGGKNTKIHAVVDALAIRSIFN